MLDSLVGYALRLLAIFGFAMCQPAVASPLVTGNGFGFAVVVPASGAATRFYPHPHNFVRADPANPLGEGIATPNYLKSLDWGAPGGGSADYVADSHVIRLAHGGSSGTLFMPFGLDRPALVIVGPAAPWRVQWNAPLASQSRVGSARLLRFNGIDEPLLLIPLAPVHKGAQPLATSTAWALVSLDRAGDAATAVRDVERWRAGLSAQALVARELAQFERWRVRPDVRFASEAERHLWRQSETMLRIAQSREPNRAASPGRPARYGNGLIVAALPDTYSTPWVRDMAWATVALARMGHQAEARAALLAYFNARPTGVMRAQVNNADYQISVARYWGDGAEEPFFTQEGSTNIEFDDWGEVLWALGEYARKYDDPALLRAATHRGPLYDSARDFIVAPLLANTEPFAGGRIVAADTSIWEEKQKDAKHFAFSTAMAIVGLREFAEVAAKAGDDPARRNALTQAALLQRGFDAAFIRDGKLRGTLEPGIKNHIDGALLPIINFGLVRDTAVIRDTLGRMELLKVASGGYRRVRGTYTDPSIFEYWYEQEEFLFVDFHWAELQRRLGNPVAADAMLGRITAKAAADHNIIPEMYVAVPCALFPGKVGDPTGAMPMVGYGAGAYVLHLTDRGRT
jgi:hypothetical protein